MMLQKVTDGQDLAGGALEGAPANGRAAAGVSLPLGAARSGETALELTT